MSLLRAAAVAAGPAPHTPIRLLARSLAAMAEPLKSVDYEVFGRVQGVCFRMYTEGEAKKIGVVGWVKNTSKGTVTGQVQGPEEKVNSMRVSVGKVPACRHEDLSFIPRAHVRKMLIMATPGLQRQRLGPLASRAYLEGLAKQGWEP
ncbi:acylphosphatase-2 isoform X2 [Arvicola amphibius]|uniref:acylphosphatase-2 isoform X2 n=1 Tax=Arvicola amphibius TaxID=1047088 RepID=UPI001C0A43C7|nr:acylphosphatase-2 isoform X2 [Arvicola amphibius]